MQCEDQVEVIFYTSGLIEMALPVFQHLPHLQEKAFPFGLAQQRWAAMLSRKNNLINDAGVSLAHDVVMRSMADMVLAILLPQSTIQPG